MWCLTSETEKSHTGGSNETLAKLLKEPHI